MVRTGKHPLICDQNFRYQKKFPFLNLSPKNDLNFKKRNVDLPNHLEIGSAKGPNTNKHNSPRTRERYRIYFCVL